MIPKQIFKIWISDKPIPEKFKQWTDTWKVNKGFKIININSCEYDSPFLRFAKEKKAYSLINHYLRCKLLYDKGGVYLDLDIECVKSLQPLLKYDFILGIEDEWVVNNAVILSKKGHPFLKECLDFMDGFKFDKKNLELETGPRMFTTIAKKYRWKQGHIGYFKGVKILAPEYFYPFHYTENLLKEHITDRTFTIHHWAQSWNDKVSIIIPCYKQAHWLADAIESALNQTYRNTEVIVVNDGSPDNTREVAMKYGKRIRYIEQPNKGLSAARNAGIKASTGNWIVPLDADDKIHPQFIQNTIGKSDIVTTYLETFGDRKEIWKPAIPSPKFKDLINKNALHCCSIFKREIWEKTGGYDESMKKGYEDWEFWTHAAKLGYKIIVHPQVLMFYRKHGKSMVDDSVKHHSELHSYIKQKHAA